MGLCDGRVYSSSHTTGGLTLHKAVSSCASDAQYHVMWIILFNALDDFGVREINEATRIGAAATSITNYATIEAAKRKLAEEALHGALRIAALVSPDREPLGS